jgi:hypothetical protein
MQHLDRDRAVVLEARSETDRGHTARAKLTLDAVAIGQGGDGPRPVSHAATITVLPLAFRTVSPMMIMPQQFSSSTRRSPSPT